MAYRSSLTRCVAMMHHQFNQGNYHTLSIIHNETGKYYTLVTDDELLALQPDDGKTKARLVCRLSQRELHTLCTDPNLDIFRDAPNAVN